MACSELGRCPTWGVVHLCLASESFIVNQFSQWDFFFTKRSKKIYHFLCFQMQREEGARKWKNPFSKIHFDFPYLWACWSLYIHTCQFSGACLSILVSLLELVCPYVLTCWSLSVHTWGFAGACLSILVNLYYFSSCRLWTYLGVVE